MDYHFKNSLVGGTFDHFHLGHQKLLLAAFEQSEKVTIGLATNELFRYKNFSKFIEDYETRRRSVSEFLAEKSFEDRTTIIAIHDIYGTSLANDYDAIFVTEETKANALKINEERHKISLPALQIITVPFAIADDSEIISSERIRKGEITREGKSYMKVFEKKEIFVLPENAREEMRRPLGEIFTDMQEVVETLDSDSMVIAVGDIVSESLLRIDKQAGVSVIDGKTRREFLNSDYSVSFGDTIKTETQNQQGTIMQDAVTTLQKSFTKYLATQEKQLIVVSGEEDLLAIPAILLAPLSAVVVYGQFDQGIVVVNVSEQNKKRVYNLFRKFE
jgi:cytidyltransferase-like protein